MEVTRKSVLLKCLHIMQQEFRMTSKEYNGREPAKGLEEIWAVQRKEISVLEDMIQALDSEPVRAALADWQMEVMKQGPTALRFDEPAKAPGKHEKAK